MKPLVFVNDWKRLFPRLWSVRLSFMAALLSALDTGISLYSTGSAPLIVAVAMLVSVSAAVARVIAQPEVTQHGG
jgi:hypothetical protein